MNGMRTTINKMTRPWRRQPLPASPHGRPLWAVAVLMCAMMLFAPQRAGAVVGSDLGDNAGFLYRFMLANLTYNNDNNGNSPYIEFSVGFGFYYMGYREGFMEANNGLTIRASKDGGAHYENIITLKCNKDFVLTATNKYEGCDLQGSNETTTEYTVGTYYHHKVRWKLPKQWRNCNVKLTWEGNWCKDDGKDNHHITNKDGYSADNKNITNKNGYDKETPYSFSVRDIQWDGDYTIAPDGTVTVPYKFAGSARNTDGETFVYTNVNGSYNGNCGKITPTSNYSAGTYSFKLSAIGKSFRSDNFTIEPYHEFKHMNDKNAINNGTKFYTDGAGAKTIHKLPKAVGVNASFDQDEQQVVVTWQSDHTNYSTGDWDTWWAIYRDGVYLTSVKQDVGNNANYDAQSKVYTFVDDECPYKEAVEYEIYYIWIGWDEKTARVEELKSDSSVVNTTLTLPVKDLASTSLDDRIVLSWTSDKHKASWGHEFRIYVDKETTPICTITPTDNQTDYVWEHRTTDQHVGRVSDVDRGIPYTEEPLNACSPHDYRVEGWVNGVKLSDITLNKRAIGSGTQFYSLNATKGVYPGMVKLSWHVNLQGSTDAKTYVIERRTAENESEPWETIISGMSSREEYLLYTDDTPLPGVYYDYRVTVIDKCDDGTQVTTDITDIGFAQTTGTLSGRITFGAAGTAVAGVDVVARRVGASAADGSQYHAMRFTGTNGAVTWAYPDDSYAAGKFSTGSFSMQMWVSPDEFSDARFARFQDNRALGMLSTGQLLFCDGTDNYAFDLYLKKNVYNHVVLTRSGDRLVCCLMDYDDDGNPVMNADTLTLTRSLPLEGATEFELGYFKGYADEFRLWTKALTKDEIMENYDHLLVGNEAGLETYWTFDEGLRTQFFDSSRSGTVYHNHHGRMGSNTEPSTLTPSALLLKAKTDLDGNYIIQGVPFSGEGTTYAIIPRLGIHEFNPTQLLRFVSNNSLVHNGTDFTDVSSFPVSGVIYYAGTTYPVEGVNFYVDGTACVKDGALVTTNSYGEFTISVPIGEHFIQAALGGHVFAGDGRYPADPNGTGEETVYFDRAITGLEFRDTTLVNFTGRVVGGDIEAGKPVGFGQNKLIPGGPSKNNIGVSRLTLTALNSSPYLNAVKEKNETSFAYNPNPAKADVPSATDLIQSRAWRGANIDSCRYVCIETDPQTGEFSAMLPPLEYAVADIVVVSTGAVVGGNVSIDLTNILRESSDTLHTDNGDVLYTYNTKLVEAYHSSPTLTVSQTDPPVPDGLFGIRSVKYKDALGEADISIINGGSYVYGHPMFKQDESYTFKLEGYEQYENYDKSATQPVVTKVPLKNTVVTIDNSLSNEQAVFTVDGEVTFEDGSTATARAGQVYDLKSNQLQLGENGCAEYKWEGGLPNVAGDFTRTISMSFDINGRQYPWNGNSLAGVILGNLPTGNNFVTSGPDKLDMILRDPPGTGSSAEWSKGSVKSLSKVNAVTASESADIGFTWKFGHSLKSINGTVVGTPGAQQILAATVEHDTKDDLTTHAIQEFESENGETTETTVSVTKAFATSAEADYVGAYGDIFIGQATNVVFGNARNIGFKRNGTGSDFSLALKDVIATSLMGSTTFAYTQGYIEDYLLPNFEKIRADLLQTTTQDSIDSYSPLNGVGYHNLGKKKGNLYLTTRTPDDEDFGADNTYTVIIPQLTKEVPLSVLNDKTKFFDWCVKEKQCTTDSIMWINQQIRNWHKHLRFNEMEKVRAYQLRQQKDSVNYENYSFNGGASYSYTIEKDSTHTSSWDWTVSAGVLLANNTGDFFNTWGIEFDTEITATGGKHEANDSINSYTSSFSYTLAEEGIDALTVDVYEYGAFGPIFRTRGGQTSNPYEGEVRTKYYVENNVKPVIMEKTMQIEWPQIDVDVNTVSDIPTGSAANYTLRLSNASEIGADLTYKLFFLDETNPQGAQLTMDGKTLTAEGRLIKVPGNQTLTKMLQLRQTDTSVLNYTGNTDPGHELFEKGIGIVFASESQPEEISDTVFIRAYFTPSSSAVDLALSAPTLNTQTGSDLTLTFSGFDRNYHNLKAFRLQYKEEGATEWTELREYVLRPADKTDRNELLPESGASVSCTLPMSAWSDGNYLFRVVSAATYGNSEVYRYSDEVALVKDMQRPRPMGQPEPADGVLDIGDDVTITFNEAFVKGELTKANNFTITGVLNGSEIAHETALRVDDGPVAVATTEASINLASKDFSIDLWMNITAPGTLLSHGQGSNKLAVGTDGDGKLVVKIGGNTYTSNHSVPAGKWAFLTMNVTADGKLSATVASADETVSLFSNKEVATYAGNGPLSVGCGASAAIHELLLWDEAHDLTTALMNRSKSKAPSTRHLIGYWKMDEGEGKEIRDYARNRHMTMANETWYLAGENKAVTLDGSHYVSINTAMLPISEYDDYAVEFWMRGGEQVGEAGLLQAGDVALWLNADGGLMMTGKGAYNPTAQPDAQFTIATSQLTDNAWHHIALNVLRQGAAAVYVDGKRVLTTNALGVGSINSDRLVMGIRRVYDETVGGTDQHTYDHPFKGEMDELRVWGATMNGDQIAKNRKLRFTGAEPGLIAYYPFEIKTLDDYNQVVTVGTPNDLTGSGLEAQQVALGGSHADAPAYTDNAPALRTKPTETNVNFTYVASDEKIVIEIDENPATIEGCTLNFNVRNVRDINGNYSNDAVWSAYVNRNELVWADDALAVTQPVRTTSSVTATIVNKGGKQQMWTLAGLPSWLTASAEYGTTNPLSETKVTFSVSESTAVGNYEETIYLVADNGIETPLTLHVKVTGNVPEWTVNPKDFELAMSLIGRLDILGLESEDEDDIVAAFVGEECRGVAHPVYNKRYDSYYVTMDIYSNQPETVTFRAYDASAGIIYPLVDADNAQSITFEQFALKGSYATPVNLAAQDKIEQSIQLGKGWNWLSLGITTDDMSVLNVLQDILDDVMTVKGQTLEDDPLYSREEDGLIGYSDEPFTNTKMYAVQLAADRTLRIVGRRINPDATKISLEPGWNWIGYYGLQLSSVTDAFAGMSPVNGDFVKAQTGVAYYDSYAWEGSLVTLIPGQGYVVNSSKTIAFSYPAKSVASWAPGRTARGTDVPSAAMAGAAKANSRQRADDTSVFTPVDYHRYSSNMLLVAKVEMEGEPLCGVELGVFAGEECRSAVVTNDEGIAVLLIPGDDETMLNFKVAVSETLQGESVETLGYVTDAVIGSKKNPFVINVTLTGIDAVTALDGEKTWYDLSGRRLEAAPTERGVYVVTVTTDGGRTVMQHLVRK